MSRFLNLRLNYFNKMILLLNIILLLITYFIYLNYIFPPSKTHYFNLISIVYPILFLFVCLFLIYWLFINWRYFILLLVVSFGTFYPFYLSYPFKLSKSLTAESTLSVMSFNTHRFKNEATTKFIADHKTDVILLQEAYSSDQMKLKDEYLKEYYVENHDLLSIYSKYPIIETKEILLDGRAKAAYADIDTGKDTIRVINVYLEPMQIEKKLLADAAYSSSTDEASIVGQKIENKLVAAMLKHEVQLQKIIPYIKNSRYPIILGCDLNSTPMSYEYIQLTNYLKDSYVASGNKNATTFHSFKFPLRIDYIFHSNNLYTTKAEIIREKFSDHYPIIVNYKLNH